MEIYIIYSYHNMQGTRSFQAHDHVKSTFTGVRIMFPYKKWGIFIEDFGTTVVGVDFARRVQLSLWRNSRRRRVIGAQSYELTCVHLLYSRTLWHFKQNSTSKYQGSRLLSPPGLVNNNRTLCPVWTWQITSESHNSVEVSFVIGNLLYGLR